MRGRASIYGVERPVARKRRSRNLPGVSENSPTPLRELALLFLKLGTIAFGGPAAHIAMMEDEVVRRRRWLTRDEFLDFVGATNLIPGPNSTEIAIHIGRVRGGWPGLLVAGGAFILPAALLVGAIAALYVRFGTLPETDAILYGVKAVVIAVVLQAMLRLARTAIKSPLLAVVGIAAVLAAATGVHELLILASAAVAMAGLHAARTGGAGALAPLTIQLGERASPVDTAKRLAGIALPAAAAPFGIGTLFWTFLKIGSVLFGSGYVLLAFLRADFVERLGWLTEQQLLDAVAVGQVTPGPVFTTATFIGYLLGGTPGAAVATLGIFLPAFVFVSVSGPLIPRLRRSPLAAAVLDGVNVASLALMAVVTVQLGRAAIVDLPTLLVALASAVLLMRYQVNSAWLVIGGAAIGALIRLA